MNQTAIQLHEINLTLEAKICIQYFDGGGVDWMFCCEKIQKCVMAFEKRRNFFSFIQFPFQTQLDIAISVQLNFTCIRNGFRAILMNFILLWLQNHKTTENIPKTVVRMFRCSMHLLSGTSSKSCLSHNSLWKFRLSIHFLHFTGRTSVLICSLAAGRCQKIR